MTEIQAFLLGMLQGLTEFLPVSSSGHLEIGNHLFGIGNGENLTFTLTVHAATVLSTVVVFRKDIRDIILKVLTFKQNEELVFTGKLLFSVLPVAVVGLFYREEVESLFTGNLILVGICLLVTSALLLFAHLYKRESKREIGWLHSLVIGIAQAIAVLPGLSRSGLTIATGILLGNDRREVARFSFLMVLLPVTGAIILDILGKPSGQSVGIGFLPLTIGFVTAFFFGWLACRWMIRLVTRGKLIYFALYCFIVGLIAIFAA